MRFAWVIAVTSFLGAGCGNSTKAGRCGDGIVQAGEQCDDGNTVAGDGCESNCTLTPMMPSSGPVVVECAHASDPPLASGVCQVTAGTTSAELITGGSVLVPGNIFHGGQVLVDTAGVIQCVDCDCTGNAAAAGATTIACPTGVVSPGLINPHDHVTYDQESPAADTGERYEARNDWRLGLRGHTKIPDASKTSADALHWNELRFVLGGATSEIGSGGTSGFLRNLDVAADQEGLVAKQAVDNETFPLDSSSELESGCAYEGFPSMISLSTDLAYQAHVSEGIDDTARNEFLCLSGAAGGEDITAPRSSFVHGVGLQPADYQKMAQTRTSLIWSPRSNVRLYGNTAMVTVAHRLGVQIALGTDWTPSGSINLLRELACADSLNKGFFAGHFSDEDLWLMVTRNAAASVNYDDVLGTLKPGAFGDITIFDGSTNKEHRAVIAGAPENVALVLRGGKPLYGDADVVNALATGCDALAVCGASKSVCAMAEAGKSLADLTTANASSYAAFFCNGAPPDEPTCTPSRPASVNGSTIYTGTASADDMDGDGIPNTSDNCPTVFNPIRPVDNGAQADSDGDGLGDACDPCPMDATAMTCAIIDPEDVDGDGVPNGEDNCPTVANADQADADMDEKGDACDACPMVANPGGQSCWTSIYDIKTKTTLVNQLVGVQNAIVTSLSYTGAAGARKAQGYFLQIISGDQGYVDENNSGVFVFGTPPTGLVVGSRVDLNPTQVTNFHGEIELQGGTPVIKNMGSPEMPGAVPVMVTPDQIATGGARATALEGVLVEVQNVTVTDPAPAPAGGDPAPTNEFAVTGGLRIDDFGSSALPYTMPGVDDSFTSIIGVVAFRNANTKVGPRTAGDLVAGPPHLLALGPNAFIRKGDSGKQTFPSAFVATLSGPAPADTVVTLSLGMGDDSYLTIPASTTISMGMSASPPILVSGVLNNATPITVTGVANGVTRTGTIRVLGDGVTVDVPTFTTLAPATGKIPLAGTINLTASLDLPPPADVALTISDMGGWTLPTSPKIAMNTLSTQLPITQLGANLTDTITVSDGTTTLMSTLTVNVHPVINEVDYDQPGTDTAEFVELYNPYATDIDLTGMALVFATKTNGEYMRVALTGTIAHTGYLVVGVGGTIPLPGAIQNGSTTAASPNPTGVALIDTVGLTVLDSVSFAGTIASGGVNVTIKGFAAPTQFAEGTFKVLVDDTGTTANPIQGSLVRIPNGQDTDNISADWQFKSPPSPGASN